MARKIVLRGEVPDDMHAIVAYLEQHSLAAADRFAEAVFAALDGLAEMPGKGSLKQFRSRKLEGVRSWAVPGFRKYLILYRTLSEAIEVLAVTHGSRRLRKLLLHRAESS